MKYSLTKHSNMLIRSYTFLLKSLRNAQAKLFWKDACRIPGLSCPPERMLTKYQGFPYSKAIPVAAFLNSWNVIQNSQLHWPNAQKQMRGFNHKCNCCEVSLRKKELWWKFVFKLKRTLWTCNYLFNLFQSFNTPAFFFYY